MREGISRRTLLAGLGTALGAALGAGMGRVFAYLDDPIPESVPNAVAVTVDSAYDELIYGFEFNTSDITLPVPSAEWPTGTTWELASPSTPYVVPVEDMKSLSAATHTHQWTSATQEAGILTEVWEEVDDDFLSQVNWPESSYISMEEDLARDGIWTEWVMLDGDIAKVFTPMSLNEPSYRVYTIPGANSLASGTLTMSLE